MRACGTVFSPVRAVTDKCYRDIRGGGGETPIFQYIIFRYIPSLQDCKDKSGLQFIKFDFVTGGPEIKVAVLLKL